MLADSHDPGEREDRGLGADGRQYGVGIPWVVLGKNIPLQSVHLEESKLPLQGQETCEAPLSSHSTVGERGICKEEITWLQPFAVLHHRIQEPAQPYDCFSGTEQHWAQHCKAFLWEKGAGPCLARSFRIWSFESQLYAREIKHRRTVAHGGPMAWAWTS